VHPPDPAGGGVEKVIASSSTGRTPVPSQSATQPRGWKRRSASVGSRGLGVDARQCAHTARKTMYSATSSYSNRSAMSLVMSGWSDVQSRSSGAGASMKRLPPPPPPPPPEMNALTAAALRLPFDAGVCSIQETEGTPWLLCAAGAQTYIEPLARNRQRHRYGFELGVNHASNSSSNRQLIGIAETPGRGPRDRVECRCLGDEVGVWPSGWG
jgi:hypothetical protein